MLLKALLIERNKNHENEIRIQILKSEYTEKVKTIASMQNETEQLIDLVAQGEDLINITASGSITLTTSTVGDVKTLNIHAPGVPDGNGTGSLTYWEETETADLVPVDDESQDLGSMTKSIRGIYLGGKLLSVNEYGELCVDHQPLAYAFAQYDGRDVVVDASDWNDVADGGEITLLQSQLTYTLEEPNNFTTPPADGGTLEEDE